MYVGCVDEVCVVYAVRYIWCVWCVCVMCMCVSVYDMCVCGVYGACGICLGDIWCVWYVLV